MLQRSPAATQQTTCTHRTSLQHGQHLLSRVSLTTPQPVNAHTYPMGCR